MIFIVMSTLGLAILLLGIYLKYDFLHSVDDGADIRLKCETIEAKFKRTQLELVKTMAKVMILMYVLVLMLVVQYQYSQAYLAARHTTWDRLINKAFHS